MSYNLSHKVVWIWSEKVQHDHVHYSLWSQALPAKEKESLVSFLSHARGNIT